MFKIAIVEDQEETRESLNRFVRQYAQEQGLQVEISLITDGAEIAEHYTPGFDIIFMDVEMPRLDGFGAAEAIRAVDADVVLVFVTNMAQYAIRGYEVDALDYVLKPVNYYQFCTKLSRAIQRVQRRRGGQVVLQLAGGGDAFTLSILGENGLSINLYTILFIAFFGIGYGAYYATADMPIPMVADCSDYETYRSGKYIPGIMGTLFSLVDKLVSSLSATVVGIAVSFVGLQSLPTQYDPYTPGHELGGHRAVLHHPHGGLGGYPHRYEGLHPDRCQDEGDPGGQCLPPRCSGQGHDAGRGHGQVADHGSAAGGIPELRSCAKHLSLWTAA